MVKVLSLLSYGNCLLFSKRCKEKMTNTKTQCQQLLNHMRTIGGITKPEAHELYFIENVGQRIAELRDLGHPIPNPARKIRTAGGAQIAIYELSQKPCFRQHRNICECRKSWWSKNGHCNYCGVERKEG